MTERHYKIKEKGDFEVTLGVSESADYTLTALGNTISPFHAALRRQGDRLFLRDLDSSEGTFINDRRIGRRWTEITLHDQVRLGPVPLEVGPTLLLGRDRVAVLAEDLVFESSERRGMFGRNRRVVCDHVSFMVEPGTFMGIMGPSGAGKTVLLNLCTGYLRPQIGTVQIGMFDVHRSSGLIKDIIGYVPQDDILIPELTVFQSLNYCLRLHYPDMRRDVRENLIRTVLAKMGFTGENLESLLIKRIGNIDQRVLSGGERRRVNMAHELVRNPLILFLDEPTSGLSSVDSEQVVSLIRKFCKENQVPTVMTIHQPSTLIFEQLDHLLLLNRRGIPVYFGKAGEAVANFERIIKKKCDIANPAEFLLKAIDECDIPRAPQTQFSSSLNSVNSGSSGTDATDSINLKTAKKRERLKIFSQLILLISRNIRVKMADRWGIFLLLAQAPIIAFLILFAFWGVWEDHKEMDRAARIGYYFFDSYDRQRLNNVTVNLDKLHAKSLEWEAMHSNIVGEHTGQQHAALVFLIIASCIWFGIVNACREIVSEAAVLRREFKTYLYPFAYLSSKVFVLFLIAALQTGILTFVMNSTLLQCKNVFMLWLILFFIAMTSSCIGLLVSAVVKSQQSALMMVPILVIPQLLFGGLIRPFKFLSQSLPESVLFSHLILQKWAFKLLMSSEWLGPGNVLVQSVDLTNSHPLEYLRFGLAPTGILYFDDFSKTLLWGIELQSLSIIAVHMLSMFLLAYVFLKKNYM